MLFAACSSPQNKQSRCAHSLQEKKILQEIDSYSGRSSNGDLVDALFDDVLKSDTALAL